MKHPLIALLPALICGLVLSLAPGIVLAFNPFQEARIDRHPDALLPVATRLVDEKGITVGLRGLAAGRPMLLVPLLHRCPNICGVTLSGLMEAVRAQSYRPGSDFVIVAMSIDPRETPADATYSIEQLRKRYPTLAGKVHALTGSGPAIAAVTDALGFRYAWDADIGQYAHVAATAVVTPDGHLSRWLYGLAPAPEDLGLALTEAGQGKIGTWSDQLLLLCYHYDPTTGQYTPVIWDALRIGGGVTAACLFGWLGLAFIRERRRTEVEHDG